MISLDLIVRTLGSLLLIVGGLGAVGYFSKKSSKSSKNLVRVHTRAALAKGVSVAVVEVAGRMLLVGIAEKGVNLLAELDPEELAVAQESVPEKNTPKFLEAFSMVASRKLAGAAPGWKPLAQTTRTRHGETGIDAGHLSSIMSELGSDGPGTGFVKRLQLATLRTQLRGPSDVPQG